MPVSPAQPIDPTPRNQLPLPRSFVAIGDSFTEGLDDPLPDGSYRGWADLVATRLAEQEPQFQYANLAIRGRLFDAVVSEQVPAALRMRPDLISFAAGGNDALRRSFDVDRICWRLDRIVEQMRGTGATVLLFTAADVSGLLPARRVLLPRIQALNEIIRRVAAAHEAVLIDLWADTGFADRRLWSEDRLHLSPLGHRRVAAHVLRALGVEADPEWMQTLPSQPPRPWLSARREDLVWVRRHFAPWIRRRLAGRSSGDNVLPKRPELAPVQAFTADR